VVSAGASEFEAQSFTSPNSFFQNQVNHGKDCNLGRGARSPDWHAIPHKMSLLDEKSAAPEASIFDEKSPALEISIFDINLTAPETSVFDEKRTAPKASIFLK